MSRKMERPTVSAPLSGDKTGEQINSRVINVVHVITGLQTGGAEMMLLRFLSRSARSSFSHAVICLGSESGIGKTIQNLGIPVHYLRLRSGFRAVAGLIKLIKLGRRESPDIVQGWMYHGNLAALWLSLFISKRPPVIWNIRASLNAENKGVKRITSLVIKLGALFSWAATRVINNSRRSANEHIGKGGFVSSNHIVIPNGFDIPSPPELATRSRIRQEMGFEDNHVVVGLIARYDVMKDHKNFLSAASLVARKCQDARFLLAGEGIDGANKKLSGMISMSGLAERVVCLGPRMDISEINSALDIAVSSSSMLEGFSNAIGEAMSCGVPCVCTDIGDSAWIVGDTGKVVPPRDSDALARAIIELVELGRVGRTTLGSMAQERIRSHFSLDKVVAQYESLYRSVLRERGPKNNALA